MCLCGKLTLMSSSCLYQTSRKYQEATVCWQAHTDVVFMLLPHFVQVPGGNAEPARILGGPPGQPICVGQTHDLGEDEYLVN